MSQDYNIITGHGVSELGNDREVVDVLNTTDKRFTFQLMITVKLHVSKRYDTQIEIHSTAHKADVILAQELQKHLSNESCKNGSYDQVKYIK